MSSKPFFTLAAYLSSRYAETGGAALPAMPPRPKGTVIWVWATHEEQIVTLRGLEAQLAADGDQVSMVISLRHLPAYLKDEVVLAPSSRSQTQMFLDHWRPSVVLWMRDHLDPAALIEIADRKVPCILVEATANVLRPEHGGWVPGLARAMLQQFRKILAIDATVSTMLLKAGADPNRVEPLGIMETAPPALSHFEDERQQTAKIIGSRPIWLAADAGLDEANMLADAHHKASRRSHRLLLIVTLKHEEDGPEMARLLQERGFLVALRSADEEPDEATQIYVADYEGEMGLWYRIAPVTFLGGSLTGGPCRNPYEAATLGSAVIHGPDIAPYQGQIRRLADVDGCISIATASELGKQVEELLAPDIAALIVHAAWEVTSRGAETTTRIADLVIAEIDAIGG